MTTLAVKWEGEGLLKLRAAVDKLASGQKTRVLVRAINHTGDKLYTQTRKLISEHTRVPVRKIDEYGAMRKGRANGGSLEYRVIATGKGIPLKVFSANQTRKGVSVDVWPRGRYLIPHAFMVSSLGGNVFFRKSKRRFPIQKLTGPSIPKQLVRPYVDRAFQTLVRNDLQPRVEHEIRVLTDGIVG